MDQTSISDTPPPWVAWQMEQYGYSTVNIANATHLAMSFYRDSDNGVAHSFAIQRNWPRGY